LLGQRQNTGFEDGRFHVPAGHLEQGETILQSLIREAQEELGITIQPSQAELALVLHQKSTNGRLGVFFLVREWKGEIKNMEPEKCGKLEWFDLERLPANMVAYARQAIQDYLRGERVGYFGWDLAG
jgi:8-oxo-dGTP pyrophosphatase MutT (NUDIX family)